MALQSKEFQLSSGNIFIHFPDLLGTGHGNTIIQNALEISNSELCILLEKYGAKIDSSLESFIFFYWKEGDLKSCRKFKNWLNKEFRLRKISIKGARAGSYCD